MPAFLTNQYLAVGRYRGENYAYSETDDANNPGPSGTSDGSYEPEFFRSLPAGTQVEVVGQRWGYLVVRADGSTLFMHPDWLAPSARG